MKAAIVGMGLIGGSFAKAFKEKTDFTVYGENRSREVNRWLARRMLAETLLEREQNRKTAEQQRREKVRRQKRRRSRRQKQKMLADKHAHSEIKAMRRKVEDE